MSALPSFHEEHHSQVPALQHFKNLVYKVVTAGLPAHPFVVLDLHIVFEVTNFLVPLKRLGDWQSFRRLGHQAKRAHRVPGIRRLSGCGSEVASDASGFNIERP